MAGKSTVALSGLIAITFAVMVFNAFLYSGFNDGVRAAVDPDPLPAFADALRNQRRSGLN